MADYRSKTLLYRWLLQRRQYKASGFTLTEVLISIAIAGVIVSGLLFLVVELLQIDRREIALERVQRDMQRAMDYIADDLKEAVYVYDSSSLPDIVADIQELSDEEGPGVTGSGDAVPLIAFWRTVPIEDDVLPDTCTGSRREIEICRVAKTRRASYSLVVYYQKHRDDGAANYPWQGESVLRRYELPQYNPGTLNVTTGYIEPIDLNNGETIFEEWTDIVTTAISGGESAVLVDFVEEANIDGAGAIDCRALIADFNSPLTGEVDIAADEYNYVLTPTDATEQTGFFACVRAPEPAGENFRATQDVYLFLRGDTRSASRFLGPASDNSIRPALQTQVKLRGVIDKDG
ncbi:type II secretion system protein [Leptothoe sp. EHU-05/26/07-4]|uniref:Type II secretion system protein n=1 Tax=Adonisia turfae CCMR0081 TaxID=2292702 RepID=A0A6M0RL90_9CYAN|nr:prepilin-type N-terminal cleavage/methylation domain-containing protein [Adonisia turfae]NEZ56431.1 type II secretion system protein [Adonisia turfae CCMR0081]